MSDKLVRIKNRYDTASNWYNNNPVLAAGEIGIDSTNNILKVGNGTDSWNDIVAINDDIPTYFLKYDESFDLYDAFFGNFGKMKSSTYIDIRRIIVKNYYIGDYDNNRMCVGNGYNASGISFLRPEAMCYDSLNQFYCLPIKLSVTPENYFYKTYDYSNIVEPKELIDIVKNNNRLAFNICHVAGESYIGDVPIYDVNGDQIGTLTVDEILSDNGIECSKLSGVNNNDTIYICNPTNDKVTSPYFLKWYLTNNYVQTQSYGPNVIDSYYKRFGNYPFLEDGVNIICVDSNGYYHVNEFNNSSSIANPYNHLLYSMTKSIESLNESNESVSKTFYKQYKLTSDNNYITTNDDGTQVFQYPIAYLNSDVIGDITGKQYMIKIDINGYNQVTIYSNSSDVNEKHYFYSLTDANASNVTDNYIELSTSGAIVLNWIYTNDIDINIKITVGNNILLD